MRVTMVWEIWRRPRVRQQRQLQLSRPRQRRQLQQPHPPQKVAQLIVALNAIMHHRKAPTMPRKHRKPISVIHFIT